MASRLRQHLSYANVVSTLCLFILLGGTSYAALKITGKNVVPETLTSRHIKNGSLLAKDFKKGQLPAALAGAPGAAGAPGVNGMAGANGAPGATGPIGATGATGPTALAPTIPEPLTLRLRINRSIGGPLLFDAFDGHLQGTNAGTGSVGGGGITSKGTFSNLILSRRPEFDSIELFKAITAGTKFPSAVLEIVSADSGAPARIELGETQILGLRARGLGEDRRETLELLVADPASQPNNPPLIKWESGAPAFPLDRVKVGELTIAGVATPIDIYSHEWDASYATNRVKLEDFVLDKALDSTSPQLLKALKAGTEFASAEIKVLRPGATGTIRYLLKDVVVKGYSLTVDSEASEELKLGFRQVVEFLPGPSGDVKACWSVADNAAVCPPS